MKNNKKGFGAIELTAFFGISIIFVGILGTSVKSQEIGTKNAKVISDIRNMSSVIEIATSGANPKKLEELIIVGRIKSNGIDNKLTFGPNNTEINKANFYNVGKLDFKKIGLDDKDFKDPNAGNENIDYLFGVINSHDFRAYQIGGQIIEENNKKIRISGTYFLHEKNTAKGLLSSSKNDIALENGDIIGGLESNLY